MLLPPPPLLQPLYPSWRASVNLFGVFNGVWNVESASDRSSSLVSSLAQQYVYPQALLQPSLLLQSQLSPSMGGLASPYLDHSATYSHYAATATGLEQYPYLPSGGYLSYSFSPSALAPAATTIHPPLPTLATGVSSGQQAFLHYPLHQADRMQ